ncbi:MAG: TonB-dependent receptor [Terriglobales bacterium]
MVNFRFRCLGLIWLFVACAGLCFAQTNTTGTITGTVTDPSGAVIPNAVVHLDQASTNVHLTVTTSASGEYSFPDLRPGGYVVTIEAKGFPAVKQGVIVQVGQVMNQPVALKLGQGATTVEVTGAATGVQVDTTTATISGVVGQQQIQNLPQIGRNFLDLAQLQPGVQMIDGGNFDPTKNGFAGLSVQGAEGRTTEVNVNGIDITDQTVGTVVTNLSQGSIQEFQVSQSSGDTSSDIGNSGQVNIITRSGSNQVHGDGFAYYRSKRFAANPVLGQPAPPFKQNQDGLSFGGPFWKNHLYWFVNGERNYRDASSAVNMPDFSTYNGVFSTPGFERDADGRLDWQVTPSLRVFYYFTHFDDLLIPPSVVGGTSLSPYQNEDVTNTHEIAAEWSTSRVTNSFRYGHVGFENHIVSNPVAGVPAFQVGMHFRDTGEIFGPNDLAPQHTFQFTDEYKYDGSFFAGNHTVRYGFEYNHIANVVYASFFGLAPVGYGHFSKGPVGSANPGDPLSYAPDSFVIFGNGLGYFSNIPLHGDPYGGVLNPRKSFYITDSWKARPNLTVNYGVHFERDPGEINTDLTMPTLIAGAFPQLAEPAKVPNNWSPTIGISWDPTGHGTTAIRFGAGMYYQNDIWNNVLFERADLISSAIALQYGAFYAGNPLMDATGSSCLYFCNSSQDNKTNSIGTLAPGLVSAQQAWQNGFKALPVVGLTNPNNAAILAGGGLNAPSTNSTGAPFFDNTYRTPYSIQMNFGVEHQFAPGVVVSANYVSSQGHDLLEIQDINNVGAARYLNQAAAVSAVNGTATDLGVATGANTIATIDNMLKAIGTPDPKGNTITADMIQGELMNGNSAGTALGGGENSTIGSPSYVFGGRNPNFGVMNVYRNLGRSNYRALQTQLTLRRGQMLRLLHSSALTVSYAFGRLNANQFDQAFGPGARDNDNPGRFYGPEGYDRTSQLSIGGVFNLPAGFVLSTVNHFTTGMPITPVLNDSGASQGEIFRTDWTGDGTTSDIVPGSNVGAYNRSIASGAQLQALINNYNGTYATTETPAAQALVAAGIATQSQLQQLGFVMPYINANVVPGQLKPDSFMDTDLRLAKDFKITEHFTISPQVEVFNLFNVGNYDPPGDSMIGALSTGMSPAGPTDYGLAGSITNTAPGASVRKFGLNTGVFAAGIPRAFQGGIRFSF